MDSTISEGLPPSCTLTFLFTDIAGSTKLWEQHPNAMRHALARQDEILRSAIETQGGYVFKTVGDAFCAGLLRTIGAALEPEARWNTTGTRRLSLTNWMHRYSRHLGRRVKL